MKVLLLFSVLLPTLLFGQITNHFAQPDSKWHVAKSYTAATQEYPSFIATTTKVYGIQGDSLINGETWSKMYSTTDSLFQNDLVYEGLTRKENSLILHIDNQNQLDTLYNFDLELGDSVFYDFSLFTSWIHVEEIQNIQINGESYRKFIFTEPIGYIAFDRLNEIWIEGIGSIHGPLFPNSPRKFSEETPDSLILTCTFSDNQEQYDHPNFLDCYVDITLHVENEKSLFLNIYPNPVSSVLTIETNELIKGAIKVHDLNGKFVHSINSNVKKTKIDVSGWENGVYFLNFEIGEKQVVKRIIVGND